MRSPSSFRTHGSACKKPMSLKSLVLGDGHFCDRVPLRRSDDFLQAQFNKLVALEKLIISEKDIDGLFLLGDVFDIPKPSLELVNRVMDHLDRINKLLPLGIYAIVGNHDVHGRVESVQETAVGTLYASRLVKQLAGKQIIKGIPFLGIDYLVNHTPEIYKGNNQIILTHNMLIPAPAIFKHILDKDNGESVFNLLDYKEEKTQKLDLEKFINGLKQSQFESQDLEKLIQEVGTLSKVDEKVIQEALERIKSARMVVK